MSDAFMTIGWLMICQAARLLRPGGHLVMLDLEEDAQSSQVTFLRHAVDTLSSVGMASNPAIA